MVLIEAPFRYGVANALMKTGFDRYQELGGIINEGDYEKALRRAGKITSLNTCLVTQAEMIARFTGVPLDNKNRLDEITVLYGVLRTDTNPGVKHHHSQMSDQRLFAEALRMLDHPELLEQVIAAYPNINFI